MSSKNPADILKRISGIQDHLGLSKGNSENTQSNNHKTILASEEDDGPPWDIEERDDSLFGPDDLLPDVLKTKRTNNPRKGGFTLPDAPADPQRAQFSEKDGDHDSKHYDPVAMGFQGLTKIKDNEEIDTSEFEIILKEIKATKKNILITGKAGTGKCYGKGTPVLMFNGEIKKIEDISKGDLVMGPDSNHRSVISTTNGRSMLYKIVPNKGESFVVNGDHVLVLVASFDYLSKFKKGDVVKICVRDYLQKPKWFKKLFKIFRTPINWKESELPIDPYFLGLWLGDGSSADVRIHSADSEVAEFLEQYVATLPDHELTIGTMEKIKCRSYAITMGQRGKGGNKNIQSKLRGLNVLNNKHIPLNYLANSEKNRLLLLAGILDSDGTKDGSGFSLTLTNKRLIDDVVFLCRSLGFSSYAKEKKTSIKSRNYVGIAYRIHISGDCSKIPIRIKRKTPKSRIHKKSVLVTGFSIQELGVGNYYGFELDGDHLHLLGDFTVSHNSTFLRYLLENLRSNAVVVAPTGIAAINVGGQTIHSLFSLKPEIQSPEHIKPNWKRKDFFKKLNILIIDEVSMVRADVLDAIDFLLREYRDIDYPFGAVQVIMFGDLFQLPPVVSKSEEKVFNHLYPESPYFFSSNVMKEQGNEFIHVELNKIYRQQDEEFISVLNKIRHGGVTMRTLVPINERVHDRSFNEKNCITLTTTKDLASFINQQRLEEIKKPEFVFNATTEGDFDQKHYPTDGTLVLKEGAQVMMIKNDLEGGRWVNGSIGTVVGLSNEEIQVEINGNVHSVTKEKWEKIKYELIGSGKTATIDRVPVGTFSQYPLKLAWAVTIHKSQGLTFDRVIIDMGRGGFAHGQTYVALSRCKTLRGIKLSRIISPRDVIVDKRITKFFEDALEKKEQSRKENNDE